MATTVDRRQARAPDQHASEAEGPPDEMERTWQDPEGWRGLFVTVQNGPIGNRFISTAFIFFLIAGVQALFIRTQLAVPDNTFLGPNVYNQMFTMHGTTMMFLFAVPIMEAFANVLLPPMLGARELPFPRMTSFGYWSYLFGGVFFYSAYLFGAVPEGGWYGYVPLTGMAYSPGLAIDFWLLALNVAEVAALGAGVELVIAVLKMRAPGMTLARMPLYAWSILVMAFSIIFAFTPFLVGTFLLEFDRKFGTRFFDPAAGGDPLLWQHLFWIFGHPDVYIQFIPATGLVSMIIPTFARRPIVGYTLIAMAVVATGFISFGLWVHHMFTVGLALLALSLFAGASMSIAIPSGVQIFAWIATIWSGRPVFKTPFLFAIGFILVFVLGGLSGVMVAAVPFNRQVHDTYFIVAHFHYVLIGGVVFPIFAALYYWMPIFSGRLLSERLGRWNFWLVFVGFNVAFFPQHIVGLLGMPRRYYTYPAGFGWEGLNLASTVGAYILGVGVALFVWNVVWSAFLGRGERVPGDPWGSGTLDFAASSPPGDVGYRHIPIVRGRYPMWEQDALDRGDPRYERITRGLAEYPKSWRAALVTSVLDGEPQAVMRMSGPSWWPFIFAIMITVVYAGTLFDWYVVMVLGLVGCIVSIVAWLWPSKDERELPEVDPDGTVHGLPVYVNGPRAVGWWAMAIVLLILAVVLGCLVFSYYYLRVGAAAWPPPDVELPDLGLAGVATAVLLLSAAGMWRAVAAIRRGDPRGLRLALGLSWALAIAFVGLQAFEYGRLGFGPSGHAYGSLFYTLAGTITTLAVGALIMGGVVQAQAWLGYFSARRFLAVENAALYWYFLAASWTITAAVLYLTPHLL